MSHEVRWYLPRLWTVESGVAIGNKIDLPRILLVWSWPLFSDDVGCRFGLGGIWRDDGGVKVESGCFDIRVGRGMGV